MRTKRTTNYSRRAEQGTCSNTELSEGHFWHEFS
jgi:hypothetical protein